MRTTRPGITLIEVLIAIFVMGIGMLAILVLFPLAALNMARALKDDRAGGMAPNVDALVTAFDVRNDSSIVDPNSTPPTYDFFRFPLGGVVNPAYDVPDPNGFSYPVWIDPFYANNGGFDTLGPNNAINLGYPDNKLPVPRLSPSYVAAALVLTNPTFQTDAMNRWFTLLDDLYFDSNALPSKFLTGPDLQRQGYYSLTYVLRRFKSAQEGFPSPVNLTVVVYQGRSVQVPVRELAYNVVSVSNPAVPPAKGDTSVLLTTPAGQPPPELRKGNWLYDASYTTGTTPLGATFGYVNGRFYRVMDAVLSGTNMTVEVYPPISDSPQATTKACMVVLDRAVEVFERGTGK